MKGDIRTMKCSDELNKEKDKKLKQQNYKWKLKKCMQLKNIFYGKCTWWFRC